jgi:hypothetical protein
MRSSYPHSQSGTGVAFLLGENGEDNAGRSFPSVHCFVHQSLANPARYRILVKAHQESDTDGWRASVHVQFNEGSLTFRDVQLPGPTSHFPTKTTAEKNGLKEAKQWVDRRLREAKILGR